MRKRMRCLAAAILTVSLLLAPAVLMAPDQTFAPSGLLVPALAEETDASLEMEVSLGYDGTITLGKPFPVRTRIRNLGEDFEGILGINASVSSRQYDRYEIPVSLPAGAEREYVLTPAVYVKQDSFTVELVRDGEPVLSAAAAPERLVNPGAMLIGILSTRPLSLASLDIGRDNDALSRYELWQTIPLTPDTFPENQELMNAFGMLVIDDLDPALLREDQQEILRQWLSGGRILLCGGGAAGARGLAYFSGESGLTLSGFASSDSVADGLRASIGLASGSGSETVSIALLSGGDALARDAEDRGLVFRSPVGAGALYTSAFEAGDPVMNALPLMHFYWQQLFVNEDGRLYSDACLNGASTENPVFFSAWSTPVHARSGLLPGAGVVLGAALLSLAGWAILRRKGRQTWMVAVLPGLSALAVAGLALLSGQSQVNQAAAVLTHNLAQDEAGQIHDFLGISAAAPAWGRHRYGLPGWRLRQQTYDYVEFDEEKDGDAPVPANLRTCYTADGKGYLTAMSERPWQTVSLACESPDPELCLSGMVEATAWMEEDGLHATIGNRTASPLSSGFVLTDYGYASVPDLQPGESASVLLGHRIMANPMDPVYEDGAFYLDTPNDLYTIGRAALGIRDDAWEQRAPSSTRLNMTMETADWLSRSKNGSVWNRNSGGHLLYAAQPISLPETALTVDGEPVGATGILSQLTVELTYLDVGPTGVVFRPAGMDPAISVRTDESGMPAGDMPASGRGVLYYALSGNPTFRFDLSRVRGVQAERLSVIVEDYAAHMTKAYALNAGTGAWDEIPLNEEIPDPARYLDQESNLFLQFRPDTQELYAEMPAPRITLMGKEAAHAAP